MPEWTYYAGSRASRADTLRLILHFNVLWRSARNSAGRLVSNVRRVGPGDTIHFVYREAGLARYIFRATIGRPATPVDGAPAIDRIAGRAAAELEAAGYPPCADGVMEVMHLEGIEQAQGEPLVKPASNQTAIWPGGPVILGKDQLAYPDRRAAASASLCGPRRRQERPTATTVQARGEGMRSAEGVTPAARTSAYFDRYLAVDWSAKSSPARGRDSIWIAEGWWDEAGAWRHEEPVNCSTRREALTHLLARSSLPGRALVGFDFAFGYPRGFAERLPGAGEPWLRTAIYVDQAITDGPRNENNRHHVASNINDLVGAAPGPFWGCHEGAATASLTPRRVGIFQFPHAGLGEFRLTDRRVLASGTPLLSVWKIDQGVSVGGQTLMGIPYLMRLRAALRMRNRLFTIWPFETGWAAAPDGITAVEIFPTLVAGKALPVEIKTVTRYASASLTSARSTRPVSSPEVSRGRRNSTTRTRQS